ncbi:MAG: PIN domain-containing protein [Thermoplasmata archaeon]
MILIVDSYAWIEFLIGSEQEPQVREALSAADVVVTPDLVLAEITRKFFREGVAPSQIRRRVEDLSTLSQITPITIDIALGIFEADSDLRKRARSRKLKNPGIADAVILSTTRWLKGRVLTADPHFEGLPETLWLEL